MILDMLWIVSMSFESYSIAYSNILMQVVNTNDVFKNLAEFINVF